jgi:hypothetical protein
VTLTIVCPYSNRAKWSRRRETFENLPTLGYPWSYECIDGTSYDLWFLGYWVSAETDLLIIEHDNAPTPSMVRALDSCPEPICVQDYNYSDGLSVHRVVVENRALDRIIGEEWTDLYGFGVVRFKLDFIRKHLVPDIGHQSKTEGPSLDSRFSTWTHSLGIKAHVHYPTSKHNHSSDVLWYGGIQLATNLGSNRELQRIKADIRRRFE